jgi:hypothetical protein
MIYNFITGEIDLNNEDKMRLDIIKKLKLENDQLNIQLGNAYDAVSFAIDHLSSKNQAEVLDELTRLLIE